MHDVTSTCTHCEVLAVQPPRVVIVGAGVGGLVGGHRAGRARRVGHRARTRIAAPGGKLREHTLGGRRSTPDPRCSRCAGSSTNCSPSSTRRSMTTCCCARRRCSPATPGTTIERLDLFADLDRSADAIGDFAGAAEARRYRAFCARARERLPGARAAVPAQPATDAAHARDKRRAGRACRGCCAVAPFATLWAALGEHFHDPRLRQLFGRYATYCGSSPFLAPATLMLVAHVEQEGVWFVEGGMQRLADALASARRAAWRAPSLRAPVQRIVLERRARRRRAARGRRAHCRRCGASSTATPLRCPRGCSATRARGAAAACFIVALAVGHHLEPGGAGARLSAAAPQRVLRRRLCRASSTPSSPAAGCRATRRSMSARRTAATPATHRPVGPERLLCLVNAPADRRTRTHPRGDRRMRTADPGAPRALRLAGGPDAEAHRADDAGGFRRPCSRAPAERSTARPRTAGGPRSRGRASRRAIPGLYLAGAARIRARACRWRRCRDGWRRERCWSAWHPGFDAAVPPGGYAWWYCRCAERRRAPWPDRHRLHRQRVLALLRLGAPARAEADPLDALRVNVALYGDGAARAGP